MDFEHLSLALRNTGLIVWGATVLLIVWRNAGKR